MTTTNVLDYVIDELLKGGEIKKVKLRAASLFSLKGVVKNSEILKRAKERKVDPSILKLLVKKPRRTLSGVTPVAIMVRPEGSCKFSCIYCPKSSTAPKSYTGEEPAALRARNANFDPAQQVRSRLSQYKSIGHPTEKCELIIMGGTFLSMDRSYRYWFIKSAYDEMNLKKSKNLEEAKKINEQAHHRVIGLTIETRPDVCGENEIDEMLEYGTTRVELGVQHPDDRIYRTIKRLHSVSDVVNATKLLKNAGFKVLYHIMPGLPGSNKKKDIAMIKKIFSDQRFRPDMLKIYPTLVIKGTELYDLWNARKYVPYSTEDAVDVISEFYKYIPEYVRVMRIQRDVPAQLIIAGVKNSNLRELVEQEIRKKNIKVKEIRLREVGTRKKIFDPESFRLHTYRYVASGADEIFISFKGKDDDSIAGFARLRIPNESHRSEISDESAVLRELRVFGEEAGLSEKGVFQHRGIGSMLLNEAERIARDEFDRKRMVVISGVGVRPYYYQKGYKLEGPYVVKDL
jgi:elongator complex protein 3